MLPLRVKQNNHRQFAPALRASAGVKHMPKNIVILAVAVLLTLSAVLFTQIQSSEKVVENVSSHEISVKMGTEEAKSDFDQGFIVFKGRIENNQLYLYGLGRKDALEFLRSLEGGSVKIGYVTDPLGCKYLGLSLDPSTCSENVHFAEAYNKRALEFIR
ncbi:hypothetical protein [Microbulbifer marinus]|uniref:hypothetical protein n=1 Tax=Microbulbifer marinus TaxID=658218 RepID=UPI00111538B8|nr:hypothetical protein [Microbulbifer marinus]